MAEDMVAHPKHYQMPLEPIEFLAKNHAHIGYIEGNVIKYVARWRKKNGIEDLQKAKFYLEYLITQELLRVADSTDKLAQYDEFEPCSHLAWEQSGHSKWPKTTRTCIDCRAISGWDYTKLRYMPWVARDVT